MVAPNFIQPGSHSSNSTTEQAVNSPQDKPTELILPVGSFLAGALIIILPSLIVLKLVSLKNGRVKSLEQQIQSLEKLWKKPCSKRKD